MQSPRVYFNNIGSICTDSLRHGNGLSALLLLTRAAKSSAAKSSASKTRSMESRLKSLSPGLGSYVGIICDTKETSKHVRSTNIDITNKALLKLRNVY